MNVHHMDTQRYLTAVIRLIKEGHRAAIPVRGSSMAPFLADGRDQVLLGPVQNRLHRGDIVLFRRKNGQFILHRIVEVKKDICGKPYYYIRGDAQEIGEGPVEPQQICAVAERCMRKGKWLAAWGPCELFFRHLWSRDRFPRKNIIAVWRNIRKGTG